MRTLFTLFIIIYFSHSAFIYCSSTEPNPVPSSIVGYTGYNISEVQNNTLLLTTYRANTLNFVLKAIDDHKIVPASYIVALRYAFSTAITGGYKMIYYVRANDPNNKKGKNYYGTMMITVAANGKNSRFVGYTIDQTLPEDT